MKDIGYGAGVFERGTTMWIARIASSVLALTFAGLSAAYAADISGTWDAKTENPMMGEMEYVYELKVDASGKTTGAQRMPFGDSTDHRRQDQR